MEYININEINELSDEEKAKMYSLTFDPAFN